eukprot:TRINITY_DN6651_c0_g4_i1.p1 TRINITY_DN6651_c0_g4~~TRINITY_DN6651_c0_g4_i1.p1  ORF type:complete len:664 (+),score=142.29 TRINITY_DN6651_c0_g4_i1:50-2041(+)
MILYVVVVSAIYMIHILFFVFFFFFFKQKTAYEMLRSLVGSEMCIRDRPSKRTKPVQKHDEDEDEQDQEQQETMSDKDPASVDNFRISDHTKELLAARGIKTLFPIQVETFNKVFEGKDMIARAKTGSGKTLGFALPIVERLKCDAVQKVRGRHPVVLVILPTRELAKQVCGDIESISGEALSVLPVYGGAPYEPQERGLMAGLDVLVGTPGRIMDHMNRGRLHLDALRYVVLDEADQMLNMGFAEDIEVILKGVANEDPSHNTHQTLLYSATMPKWVQQVANKYVRPDYVRVDIIGTDTNKTAVGLTHLAISCFWHQRATLLGDLISVYAPTHSSRVIVFADTKKEANELVLDGLSKFDCHVLHGDIAQNQRETTLEGFRQGKFNVLVATDVAARGLDIPNVDLVLQAQPPKEADTYVHRSGRTARAGKTGTSICIYQQKEVWQVEAIQRKIGRPFQIIQAPQPEDIMMATARASVRRLENVKDTVVPYFREAAQDVMDTFPGGAVDALAAALAELAGMTEPPKPRSLLSADAGHVSFGLRGETRMHAKSYAWNILRNVLQEDVVESIKGLRFIRGHMGVVFDVPTEHQTLFEQADFSNQWMELELLKSLPELEDDWVAPSSKGSKGKGGKGSKGGKGKGSKGKGKGKGFSGGRGKGTGKGK